MNDLESERNLPGLPVPAPLQASERGTFTEYSVKVRLLEIGQRTMAEAGLPPAALERLATLLSEIPNGQVRPLTDVQAPDAGLWQRYLAPYLGQNWLEVPWFFIEAYFYRRILEACGYFIPGESQGKDPFAAEKERGLTAGRQAIMTLYEQAAGWHGSSGKTDNDYRQALVVLLQDTLWGNQVDLSLWPAPGGQRSGAVQPDQSGLLADDSARLSDYIFSQPRRRVDILVDNAGVELIYDLILGDFLLASRAASAVYLHLKPHPVFVSDALPADVLRTLEFLSGLGTAPAGLAARLNNAMKQGKLALRSDFFWTSPLAGWEMPASLHQELAESGLLVSKGDAHYRRWLGDRHWGNTTSLPAILRYRPAPLALLRVLKSEVAAGLDPARVKIAGQVDPSWLYDGKWGVIQFVE